MRKDWGLHRALAWVASETFLPSAYSCYPDRSGNGFGVYEDSGRAQVVLISSPNHEPSIP